MIVFLCVILLLHFAIKLSFIDFFVCLCFLKVRLHHQGLHNPLEIEVKYLKYDFLYFTLIN